MLVFNFHPVTKELLDTSNAELDPLESETSGEDVFMLPAHATFDEPPVIGEHQAAVWIDDHWSVVDDYRGTVYWLDGEKREVSSLGETVPDGASLTAPDPEPSPPTRSDINSERDRRIALGCVVTLSTGKVVPIQGRPQDQTNLLGLVTLAQMRKLAGDITSTTFRDRDNSDHDLTPDEVIELWQRGVAYFELVMQAAWALKDLDPIPADYQDDIHWPAAS